MTIICSWCKKDMGVKYPKQPGITHGICKDCLERVKAESASVYNDQGDGLNAFGQPVTRYQKIVESWRPS